MVNKAEIGKKLDELSLVISGLTGSSDDMMEAGRIIGEIRAMAAGAGSF